MAARWGYGFRGQQNYPLKTMEDKISERHEMKEAIQSLDARKAQIKSKKIATNLKKRGNNV